MDGIAWASSALVAARTRLEIATANLANVSTDGFRAVLARGRLTAHGVEIDRTPAPASEALEKGGVKRGSVDAIAAMIDVLDAERSFESATQVVRAIDGVRQKNSNDVGRMK
jgi:flagellar basal body rod protein FlgG